MRTAGWMGLLLVLMTLSQARAQSPIDGFDPGANDLVRAIAVDDQGRTYLGGRFTTVSHGISRARLARIRPDGSLDPGFNPGANGDVTLIRTMANGRVLVAGQFTEVGGVARFGIAMLQDDGTVLPEFNLALDGAVYAYTPTVDGGFAIGGGFETVNGQPRNRVARFDHTMQLLPDVGGGANGTVQALLAEADGSLLVGGYFNQIGGRTQPRLARLRPNGAADPDFLPGLAPNAAVWTLLRSGDGGVFVGGLFTTFGAELRSHLAKLTPGGALDAGFAPMFDGDVLAMAEQVDGKLVVGGSFVEVDGEGSPRIARLRASGQLDPVFNVNTGANDDVLALALQYDGKLLIGGAFNRVRQIDRFRVARLQPGGQLDRTMDLPLAGSDAVVRALAADPWDGVVLGGEFSGFAGGPLRDNLGYVQPDGTLLDNVTEAWKQGTDGTIHAMLWHLDQVALYVGGDFEFFDGVAARGIVRLKGDGSRDEIFNAFVDGSVEALALIGDRLLLAGDFSAVNGIPRSHLAIVDGLGQLDPDFAPEIDGPVSSVAVDHSGRILIAGAFSTVNGASRPYLARLVRVGGVDFVDAFAPAPDGSVTAISLDADQRLYVGGFFDQIAGASRRGLARLLADDSLDPGLDLPLVPASGHVRSFGLTADGRVILGGQFNAIDGVPRANLARIRPGTSNAGTLFVDSTFVANTDAPVQAVAILPDGKVMVAGYFDEVGGIARRGLARLDNGVAAIQSFSYYPTSGVHWNRRGSLPELAARPGLQISAPAIPPKNYVMQRTSNGWSIDPGRLSSSSSRTFRMRGATTGGQRGGSGGALEWMVVRHDPAAAGTVFADGFEN